MDSSDRRTVHQFVSYSSIKKRQRARVVRTASSLGRIIKFSSTFLWLVVHNSTPTRPSRFHFILFACCCVFPKQGKEFDEQNPVDGHDLERNMDVWLSVCRSKVNRVTADIGSKKRTTLAHSATKENTLLLPYQHLKM